ncbi:hypothetical protein BCR34DRAFT_545514 [Clohesyomyces aquaticus]|uniref:Tat pathway signal sequence n=1 Tax=Clohesyomyces aquaticus TaxID=1231657 RepID=A0A1Y1YZ50_9PLEO|nr:hypothetical protein BCR34DRAFT_545514 [Clohesyomyces aquaticus]
MASNKEGYSLLEELPTHDGRYKSRRNLDLWFRIGLGVTLGCSLVYNVFQARSLVIERSRPDHCRSNFSGLAYDTPVVYESTPAFNGTSEDEYWSGLDASPFAIALGAEDAKKYGLGPSVPFPWDDEKQIYYIKAFHHIHCLKIIRHAFKVYESGVQYKQREHLYHCINALRQDIMCKPDDSIMSSRAATHVIGDGQVFQCRNWDKLVDWAQDPVRNACFRVFDDDRHVAHQLEVYSFCPKDSPYYATVQAYYERHGHKPIYEDDDEAGGYTAEHGYDHHDG